MLSLIIERLNKESQNRWVDKDLKICCQIMEGGHKYKLLKWIDNWKNYANFEGIEVITSKETEDRILS
ncbi:MAG: hypothetical protein MI974_20040 [Chitinophagales bacterium]|nr:hypothetical protein [Chitinophagales bacterium]